MSDCSKGILVEIFTNNILRVEFKSTEREGDMQKHINFITKQIVSRGNVQKSTLCYRSLLAN